MSDSPVVAVPPIAGPPMAPADPTHTGMGAIPYPGGVTFRVWSMFADSVAVAGDFNGWTPTPMERDAPACTYWSVDVPGATVGQAYKFVLPYAAVPGRNAYRMDPYASSLKPDGSGNVNAVVASVSVPYQGGSYSTPPWNEAVLYELHIPTFNSDAAAGRDFRYCHGAASGVDATGHQRDRDHAAGAVPRERRHRL